MSTPSSSGLNEAQYQAVYYRNGPLLVLAGAGSGKTRVITERIAALVERDVPDHAITAVTFTNKAAKEMRERLQQRLGDKAKGLRICTFHALGLAMVREHADLVGRKANVSVFAGTEQKTVMRSVLTELKLAADADQVDRMVSRVSSLKSGLLAVHDNQLAVIRQTYDALLEKMNAVDFDDLLVMPVTLMTDHASVRAIWRERARYFLVDEYQDSSRIQYQLVRLLVPDNGNLTVVGDDDQSIYGWRGAEVKNLFQLERDYTSLNVVRLEENYRSTGSILQASNSLIANNAERLGKTLRSTLGQGKPIRVWGNPNPDEEGRRLAGDIKSHHARSAGQWDAYCVLYRASFQARPVELALREAGIPYHVSGGLSFFDRAEIQDTLAYLRLIANFNDDLAFMRAIARPRRGVGSKALGDLGFFAMSEGCSLLDACLHESLDHKRAEVLREFGDMIVGLEHQFRHGEPDEAFDAVLDMTRLEAAIRAEADDQEVAERRMGNVLELRRWWVMHTERGGDLTEFLQHIFLMAERQDDDPSGQVRLMTVHAAKGLEFDHVYVIGMEEGIFPHRNALEENRMEEERRLMYVAMTRARFMLTLSYSLTRRRFGMIEKSAPSLFLKEPDQSVLRWVDKEIDSEDAKEEAQDHMAAMRKMLGLD
ncbi:MAG: ATP-dependent DNA helicase Rep [Zetaproteobacteria bacterium CG12_big_fil_rev_8_21_14_0_65_54_13]|nr:MAG: ATP-dependent DNA helicase Rep [Zetaproteobacteria bacterium CG12_big_fil_rev_8_21_14_0_65_54_13]PIX53361.1 MAG: ATP-dependent DNA helicase Rep [Zetaproteobacteria bacterium CG_4_10_14_3_um_filter_54_28]PJA30935.1 MAG: ATP-dependent DNA helicase Rep [Zetaproteobacteria bacterium CG_4_9_14_3_um_filter_54_145]